MEPFIVGVDITDIKNLYGRTRQLNILISCAKRKGNAGIIGARRFGKTCVLKSMEHFLNSNEDNSSSENPVKLISNPSNSKSINKSFNFWLSQ